jgi:CheY-like chemotaxis protein
VLQPRRLDLAAAIAALAPTLGRMIGERVTLVLEPPSTDGADGADGAGGAGGAWIDADPGQIEQVVLNLAINARDAMPDGGRLTIAVRDVPPVGAGRPGVALRVTDTGIGMDPETEARVFEPFFTTKATGRGTGLGLATVYGIVAQSGGSIRVDTAPGRGTTFEVVLPAAEAPAAAAEAAPPARTAEARGGETLLLVEDDPAVRAVLHLALRGAGYGVVTAHDGQTALHLIASRPGGFDAMITDVVMPGMTGPELATAARRRQPGLRVLFISGYAHGAAGDGPGPDDAFLAKPFEPTTLLRRVRELLEARAPGA